MSIFGIFLICLMESDDGFKYKWEQHIQFIVG